MFRYRNGRKPAAHLAIDDRRAVVQARRASQTLRIFDTQDLVISMIGENLLDITEADSIRMSGTCDTDSG